MTLTRTKISFNIIFVFCLSRFIKMTKKSSNNNNNNICHVYLSVEKHCQQDDSLELFYSFSTNHNEIRESIEYSVIYMLSTINLSVLHSEWILTLFSCLEKINAFRIQEIFHKEMFIFANKTKIMKLCFKNVSIKEKKSSISWYIQFSWRYIWYYDCAIHLIQYKSIMLLLYICFIENWLITFYQYKS